MTGREERVLVKLSGGCPWGFRLQGGAGTGLPLIVSKVRRKSKAYRRLREGDRILKVNGRSCEGLTYDQLMDIADKSEADLTMEILRRESDKENQPPIQESAVKTTDNIPSTKEIVSVTETSSKITEEKEGLRIKSAKVVPDTQPYDSFSSPKLEVEKTVSPIPAVEPFPSFKDLQSESEADSCTSSKQEFVTGDDKNFSKTTVETKHEVKGGTETSFIKKEQESFSKSTNGMPDITMDTIDLNNLISETQKRLDSFKNNFKTDGIFDTSLGEIKKTEIVSSSETTEAKSFETSSATCTDTSIQNTFKTLEKNTETEVSKPDPIFSLPDVGFTSQSSESSTVTTDIPFGTSTTSIMKKKKMFSSSSFYEEPQCKYPTVEEQVEMARKIADSLADDTNKKSKGANMFYKRVKRSSKWIHEGPEPSDESAPGTPEIQGVEPPTPDPLQVPFRPSKGPPKLKLVLDPRQILDLNALRSSGYIISEHNVVSPEVCHGLVKDLQSPVGKGAALFAKRKKKSEEWVVDEEKVKALMREQERKFIGPPLSTSPAMSQYPTIGRQEVKLIKTPWEAAMENPYGYCDSAFARVNPDQLADTVMRRADFKRSESLSRESSRMEGCISPPVMTPLTPAAATYDIYHAKSPKGWLGNPLTTNYSSQVSAALSPSPSSMQPQQVRNLQNGYQTPRKMVFQNFNAVPRLWRGTSVR